MPGLANFQGYRRDVLRGDVLGGLTVSAYLVPQALAYATLAGLPPAAGLWAALPPLVIYAILGSSRQLSIGPESTTALMTAAVLGSTIAGGDPARYAAYAATLAVLVGAICLVAGLLRLGFLANLLSRPVLVGYLAGIAAMMVASQLGRLAGVSVSGQSVDAQLRSFATELPHWHWPTVLLSAAIMALIFALDRWAPRVPGPLIGVLAASALMALFAHSWQDIAVVGAVPSGLPLPGWPIVSGEEVRALIVPAMGIAVVAFSDNVLTARAFASRTGADVDPQAELRALGACNLVVGVFRGFPISSSGSRTALADAAGARTQVYSLVVFAVVAAALLFGGGIMAGIPSAALGALVVFAATKLVDVGEFRRLARFRRSELYLALATTAAVLLFGVLYGVLVAVALSVADLLHRLAHAHDSVQGIVPGLAGMHDVDDYPAAKVIPGLVVYRYDAPLFFANAADFHRRALAALDQAPAPVHWFVLNAESNVEIDVTALDALEQLRRDCERRGVVFVMARVKQDLRDALAAGGLLDKIGAERIYLTLPTAVAAYRAEFSGDQDG
ncbi:sulfate permease [Mycolicibacterium diernhoferi]|uniref:Sodium-independent anion transporter n=2 Tax=Mycolicibacterium diernhoferi TaxID=1801 RepID=A0A1Q4HFA4_9MYCO|nr:sodium-independent anion transporter [Mycolicibacterium diernhoferi]OPE54575.1 sodium-independent anion transporter [Mycolicibacterium diernhoferi]PEG54639.1 sodium-independent anion transporter [Mycolicibacterium diernhoferi]QYL25409.1 sulfate permease [Mycolicibacterium diernhoferi]